MIERRRADRLAALLDQPQPSVNPRWRLVAVNDLAAMLTDARTSQAKAEARAARRLINYLRQQTGQDAAAHDLIRLLENNFIK